jgi:hypothetical protein
MNGPEKGARHRNGFSNLAAWLAHDPDNESFVFRKFDRLSARNLLNLQNELLELEWDIDYMDKQMSDSGDPDILLSMRKWTHYQDRAKIAGRLECTKKNMEADLEVKIKKYREFKLATASVSQVIDNRPTR